MVGWLKRILSAASSTDKDKPSAPIGEAAPLSADAQYLYKLLSNTITNPDPLMAQQRPTNTASYLAGFGLYEEMLDKDPALYGYVKQRQLEALASPRTLNPASDDPEAMRVHSFIAHWMDSELGKREDTFGEIWMAVFYGVSYLEADYRLRDVIFDNGGSEETLGEAVVIDRFLSRRRGRFVFGTDYRPRLLTGSNLTKGEELPERKILHVAPRRRYENPYGEPLARVVFTWHFMKKHAAQMKIRDLERFGSPFPKIKRPAAATDAQISACNTLLRSIQTGFGCHYPDDLDLELDNVYHSAADKSPHEAWADFCDKQMALATLGQTLTSQQGDKGARSLGEVHDRKLDNIVQNDADGVAEAFNQAIRWLVELNFGSSALHYAPTLSIDASRRDVAAYLANVKSAQDVGLKISESQTREETGFESPDDDDALEPPARPSPFGPGGNPSEDDPPDPAKPKPTDENRSQRAERITLVPWTIGSATHDALSLTGAIRSARPASFTQAENRRARLLKAELADHLPAQGELRRLYDEGVSAQSKVLGEIPELVTDWVREQYEARGIGPDDVIGPETPVSDPTTLPWQDLAFPDRIKQAFVDRLNNDHTTAQLLAREAVLLKADALGVETPTVSAMVTGSDAHPTARATRAAADDPIENPLATELFGSERIIPREVLSVHTRRVYQSVEFQEFYQLDSLGRAASFTAWDLLEADVRHIGGALQDAINWGYTVQQFEDYLLDRLKPRYVQQGSEMHAWHIQTIYHQNLSAAHNTALADEADEIKDSFPYVLFYNPDPQAPPCVERAGKVYRVDGGILRGSTPPLHFGCQSNLELMTERGLSDEGLAVEQSLPTVTPEVYAGPKDPFTGEPVGEPHPFGAWAPVEERYQHLEQELARVRSES
jgi:phage gp29-like protein